MTTRYGTGTTEPDKYYWFESEVDKLYWSTSLVYEKAVAPPTPTTPPSGTMYQVGYRSASGGRFIATLYSIDLATDVRTRLATITSAFRPHGLATIDDTLYMVDDAADALFTLDPVTGAATRVGSAARFGDVNIVLTGPIVAVDQTLYMFTDSGTSYTINTETGVGSTATLRFTGSGLTETFFRSPNEHASLAYSDGLIYALGRDGQLGNALFTLDPSTGEVTKVALTTDAPGPRPSIRVGVPGLYGLDVVGGVIYGYLQLQYTDGGNTFYYHGLFTINPDTGVCTSVKNVFFDRFGINRDRFSSMSFGLDPYHTFSIVGGSSSNFSINGYEAAERIGSIMDASYTLPNRNSATITQFFAGDTIPGRNEVRFALRSTGLTTTDTDQFPRQIVVKSPDATSVRLVFAPKSEFGRVGTGNIFQDYVLNTAASSNHAPGSIIVRNARLTVDLWYVGAAPPPPPEPSPSPENLTRGLYLLDNQGILYSVDASDYSVKNVGVIAGFGGIFASSMASIGKALYVLDKSTDAVYKFDKTIARATRLGLAQAFNIMEDDPRCIETIGNVLYMAGEGISPSTGDEDDPGNFDDTLFTVHLLSGVAAQVGRFAGGNARLVRADALGSIGNTLYMAGAYDAGRQSFAFRFNSVNTSTGATTLIGSLTGLQAGTAPLDMTSDGTTLWMLTNQPSGSNGTNLYTVNTASGAVTRVAQLNGIRAIGLAWIS